MRYNSGIKAKSSKARASIAIRMMKTYKTLGRSFDNCFEMYDGEAVRAEIIRRTIIDETLKHLVKKIFNWPEVV